jgi:hypothetical protein
MPDENTQGTKVKPTPVTKVKPTPVEAVYLINPT